MCDFIEAYFLGGIPGRINHSNDSKRHRCSSYSSSSGGEEEWGRGREKEGERGREKEGERGREKEGERGREKEGERGREKEGERGREKEGERGREGRKEQMEHKKCKVGEGNNSITCTAAG